MIRRPRYAPADAERLTLDTCVTTEEVPSKFARGLKALKLTLRCPGCGMPQREASFQVDTIVNCGCGLSMIVEPDCVYIWRRRTTRFGRAAASIITAFTIVGLASFGFYRGMKALDRQQDSEIVRVAPKDMARMEERR